MWLSVLSRFMSTAALYTCAVRFKPEVFGEFSYLLATGATLAILCGLSIEISINAISAKLSRATRAVFLAGLAQACLGIIASTFLCWGLIQFNLFSLGAGEYQYFIVWVSSNALLLAMLNAILFSRGKKAWVSAGWCGSAIAFGAAVIVGPKTWGSAELLYSYCAAQTASAALIFMVVASELIEPDGDKSQTVGDILRRSVSFGSKQVTSTSVMAIALWLVQTAIMDSAGPGELANYTLSLQVYNSIIFFPAIFGPPYLSKMARIDSRRRLILTATAFRIFCAAALLVSGGMFIAASLLLEFLPPHYLGARVPIFFACIAAAIHFSKAPFSIFFQSALTTRPDVTGTLLGTTIVIACLLAFSADASTGQLLRVLAHTAQFTTVFAMFIMYRRAISSEQSDRSL